MNHQYIFARVDELGTRFRCKKRARRRDLGFAVLIFIIL